MSLILVAIVQSLLFGAALSQGTCKETSDVRFTFYGMAEGGKTTAFSCGENGGIAGGIGTYSNPETFATSRSNPAFSKCEIVYVPYFQKYFQFTDYCVQCDTDYHTNGALHIDLWIGATTNAGSALCEETFGSIQGQTIIQSPPSSLPFNSGELWDGTSCHDASSANPFVYVNPSTSGLCAGGGSSSPAGGSPVRAQKAQVDVAVVPPPVSTSTSVILPPVPQPTTTTPVVQPAVSMTPSSSTTTSTTTPADVTTCVPTTMVTVVTIVASQTPTTTSSNPPGPSSKSATCTAGHGCLGDPCQTFSDCNGDWICMGVPLTCHDNTKD